MSPQTRSGKVNSPDKSEQTRPKKVSFVLPPDGKSTYLRSKKQSKTLTMEEQGSFKVPNSSIISISGVKSKRRDEDFSDDFEADVCIVCERAGKGLMIDCDRCSCLFHLKCLNPPLTNFPKVDWFCQICEAIKSSMEVSFPKGMEEGSTSASMGVNISVSSDRKNKRRRLIKNGKQVSNNKMEFPSLLTRMSPKGFRYVIRCLETYSQWKAIEEMGFSGLYWLEVNMLPLQLCYWLLENYCPFSNTLILPHHQKLELTEMDVHATLGLPMGPNQVKVAPYKCADAIFESFFNAWIGQFNITTSFVPLTVLQQKIVEQVEGDYWFKVNFIVYVTSVLLYNSQKAVANRNILMSLMDVDEIANYNWCGFVLKALREKKKEWMKRKKYFGGPLIFLLIS